jgi:hypothetical protein
MMERSMFLTIRLRWPDYQQLLSEGFGGNLHGCCFRLCRDPVAVAWGLAGDEEAASGCASVHSLMVLAGGDFEAFAGVKDEVVMLYFESEFPFEHKKELAGVDVGVTRFAGAGRHELFDDAELGRFDKVPAVAVGALWASPLVVFGGFCADDFGGQVSMTLERRWRSGLAAGAADRRQHPRALMHFSCRSMSCRSRGREAGSGCRRALPLSRKQRFSRRLEVCRSRAVGLFRRAAFHPA